MPSDKRGNTRKPAGARPKAVIVGAGFGGLAAAKRLANQPIDVTLVDQRGLPPGPPKTLQAKLTINPTTRRKPNARQPFL